ncbi:MAG: 50S ribosomal protein L13 [Candidatus Woesearchaeota archaeon]
MAELYIDAENAIIGRLGAHVAKRALLGDTVKVLNCEKAIISGRKESNVEKYHHAMKERGRPAKGPYYSRMPDRFVRRVIRGMLPHKKVRGRDAYSRIMCYIGIPEEFKNQKLIKIAEADISKLKAINRATVGEVCKALRQK